MYCMVRTRKKHVYNTKDEQEKIDNAEEEEGSGDDLARDTDV